MSIQNDTIRFITEQLLAKPGKPVDSILAIMSATGDLLKLTLQYELQCIHDSDLSPDEQVAAGRKLIEGTTEACFDIMAKALPIEIRSSPSLTQADSETVLEFAKSLIAKHETTH